MVKIQVAMGRQDLISFRMEVSNMGLQPQEMILMIDRLNGTLVRRSDMVFPKLKLALPQQLQQLGEDGSFLGRC